jgi:C1A family cysteine protease
MPQYNISGFVKQAFDAQDRIFSAPETAEEYPSSFLLPVKALSGPINPAWSQLDIGSCGPHTALFCVLYSTEADGVEVEMPSRLGLYWMVRSLMGTVNQDSGVDNRNLMKALNKFGFFPERMMPYDTSRFRERPSDEAFAEAAKNKIAEYRAVPQSLNSFKACLAGNSQYQGRPFIFGFSVYPSLMTDSTARTGNIPMPTQNDLRNGPIGGHDIAVVGYDQNNLIIRNSWDTSWGSDGYGTIPLEYALNPQLASDFWVPYRVNPLTA